MIKLFHKASIVVFFLLVALALTVATISPQAFAATAADLEQGMKIGKNEQLTQEQLVYLVKQDLNTHLDGGFSGIDWRIQSVTARKLQADFDANEVSARRRYGSADIVVSGEVLSVDIAINKPVVTLRSDNPFVGPAFFVTDPAQGKWLESLAKGRNVAMACRKIRRLARMVYLHDCEQRSTFVEKMAASYVSAIPALARRGDEMARFLLRKSKAPSI